jgi:hypothetical protein
MPCQGRANTTVCWYLLRHGQKIAWRHSDRLLVMTILFPRPGGHAYVPRLRHSVGVGQPSRGAGIGLCGARFRAAARSDLAAQGPAKRLASLEEKTESLAMQHDTFGRNTRAQLRQVFKALHELTVPAESARRPIGFVTQEKKNKPAGKARSKAARKKV